MKIVICQIGEEEYAIDIHHVLSIEKMKRIHSYCRTPPYVSGFIHLREDLITVLDARTLLNQQKDIAVDQNTQRIIIICYEENLLGLTVDAALDVIDVQKENIKPLDLKDHTDEVTHVATINERLLLLLDVEKMIDRLKRIS